MIFADTHEEMSSRIKSPKSKIRMLDYAGLGKPKVIPKGYAVSDWIGWVRLWHFRFEILTGLRYMETSERVLCCMLCTQNYFN
jgi:hypothetical protein